MEFAVASSLAGAALKALAGRIYEKRGGLAAVEGILSGLWRRVEFIKDIVLKQEGLQAPAGGGPSQDATINALMKILADVEALVTKLKSDPDIQGSYFSRLSKELGKVSERSRSSLTPSTRLESPS